VHLLHTLQSNEFRRLPITQRDRARLVEQKCVDVTGRLDRTSAHGKDIVLYQSIHSRDANGRKQSTDRCWNEADE
jgi:hypothetical protein